MKSNDNRRKPILSCDLLGHYAAVHHMNYVWSKIGKFSSQFLSQPVINLRAFAPAIQNHNSYLQAERRQTLDLLLDEYTAGGRFCRGIHVSYSQDSHFQAAVVVSLDCQ